MNAYRGISKNKTDFQKKSRYRQLFLKYDYFVGVINDLRELKYINEKKGYRFPNHSQRTRIAATDKLIDKILLPDYGFDVLIKTKGLMEIIKSDGEGETIILKDAKDNLVEYEDNDNTNKMRDNLRAINHKIANSRIELDIDDKQYEELEKRISGEKNTGRPTIDFNNTQLHRVFNNSSWELDGRFYGGWWQNVPKEYRKYIEINHKPTVELDYSGHHIRILYAREGLEPPDDPYDLDNYDREDQKEAMLIMLNASTPAKALKAMSSKGIKNTANLAKAIAIRHEPIHDHFSKGVGLGLMFLDSLVAERIMLLMLDRGATVLPVHDSFIVRNSYEQELEEVMKNVFEEMFGKKAKLKIKKTMLEEVQEQKEAQGIDNEFITDDLEELLEIERYKWNRELWGGLG